MSQYDRILDYVILPDGKCPFPGFNNYISACLYSYLQVMFLTFGFSG